MIVYLKTYKELKYLIDYNDISNKPRVSVKYDMYDNNPFATGHIYYDRKWLGQVYDVEKIETFMKVNIFKDEFFIHSEHCVFDYFLPKELFEI
jgi:hypothetical protein